MPESRFLLKCPYCKEEFEISSPDQWHTTHSYEEPRMNETHGEVKNQEVLCKNKNCTKKIIIYWYAPMEYYNSM